MSKLPISAVLITKNEAHNLLRCIGSLGFCGEVIVLDSGSTDDTVSVAESLGATVYKQRIGQVLDRKRIGHCLMRPSHGC